MAEPQAIGVNDVALTVLGDLANVSVAVVLLDFYAASSPSLRNCRPLRSGDNQPRP
jgi:hypothetical protein